MRIKAAHLQDGADPVFAVLPLKPWRKAGLQVILLNLDRTTYNNASTKHTLSQRLVIIGTFCSAILLSLLGCHPSEEDRITLGSDRSSSHADGT